MPEALAGKEFFCDSALDLRNKDSYQKIQGVWIYELAELDALLKAESSEAKAFLTSTKDRFRPPYGKCPIEAPRSVVFCGTVNHGAYLKDPTGNRRFWTIRCTGKIERAAMLKVRDQLWAEAVALYKSGEQWHLTHDEEKLMVEEQRERLADEPFEAPIREWLKSCPPHVEQVWGDDIQGRRNGDSPFEVDKVFKEALGIALDKQNPAITKRVAEVLRKLGYERKRISVDGERVYRYMRAQ